MYLIANAVDVGKCFLHFNPRKICEKQKYTIQLTSKIIQGNI
jgi:hypothetical protein